MSNYKITVNGKEYAVELLSMDGTTVTFRVGDREYTSDISPVFKEAPANNTGLTAQPQKLPASSSTHSLESSADVVAPMPGIVIDIRVSEGEAVTVGQVLLVMEAMKMENNISARRAGTVKKIHVKAGQEVKNSQALISLE